MISEQRGATLIDVLIACFIVATGVLGIIRLQLYMEQHSSFADKSVRAVNIAQNRLERLSVELLDGAESIDNFNQDLTLSDGFRLKVQLSELPARENEKVRLVYVLVEVSWFNSKNEFNNIHLMTVMANT